jgi:hypothetical protein
VKRERLRERKTKRNVEREGERDVEYGCFIYIFNRNYGYLGNF